MGKIKNFISKSKREIQIITCSGVVLVAGLCIGKKLEACKVEDLIASLGDNSSISYKLIDDNLYTLLVIKD